MIMKKSRFSFMLLFLACISINAQAVEPEYKSDTKELTIPSVKVDGVMFYDVRVRLNDPQIIESSKISSSGCPAENAENFLRIKDGMNLDEVKRIIGCDGVLLNTGLDDGILKEKYIWKFTPGDASIVLDFERGKFID